MFILIPNSQGNRLKVKTGPCHFFFWLQQSNSIHPFHVYCNVVMKTFIHCKSLVKQLYTIPHICHFFYTGRIFKKQILHPKKRRLGDILSQGQIVPTAFLGRQIVPSDKMSHFLPRDKLSHQTNCPISSPETKCPTDALIKNHCSTGIFRETNCPIRQIVPLSPRRQNVPTYALMHKKVMESCWDILSPVILSNFWETFERLLRDF